MNPKRRFFQIHLSTAVVLMLVAGVLLWANVRAEEIYLTNQRDDSVVHDNTFYGIVFGWPFRAHRYMKWYSTQFSPRKLMETTSDWNGLNAFYNALIALAILLSVCVVCEWRIRRRAVPPQKSP